MHTFPVAKGTTILPGKRPTLGALFGNPVLAVAFGFGTGLSPIAPGTVGTLLALPLWWALADFGWIPYLFIVGCTFVIGIWICGRAAAEVGQHDHSGIVFDEIVGYLVALAAVPFTLWAVVFSFVVFRLLDALKPWPICWLDRHVKGGLGVMLDDLVAGAITALIVLAARALAVL